MKEIYEMHGRGRSARAIARDLGLARNTVLRYLNSPEAMVPKPRPPRGSKLDPYTGYIDQRLAEGLENCVVLLRELRALGYQGSYTILVEYARPRRRGRQPEATMRFETAPGEQAQVDWGSLPYIGEDGKRRRVWVFVMTMGWSRACYVELVRRADTAAFIQCHANAFEYLGGVPRRCLYDNAKVVTLGRDDDQQPVWNLRMLDFALRVGFEIRLCQPYRAQTKGKVESGVKYVRRNMWPSMCFTDDADLNRQALEWCDVVANARVHGTTYRIPWEMLDEERAYLGKLPDRATLAPYLREDRKVARDGFVSWEDSRYGVHWKWVGRVVQGPRRPAAARLRVLDQTKAAEVQLRHLARRGVLHPDRVAAPAPPVAAGDEPVQRGIRYWATPLRQQLLNSGELQAAAGEPLVDLVGPGSQSVLGGHRSVLRPGTADCRQTAELLLGGPRSLAGYSHALGQRNVLPDGFPGQSRPCGYPPPAAARLPAADHFRNVHSLHLLVGHHHTSPRSAAMVSYQALKVA